MNFRLIVILLVSIVILVAVSLTSCTTRYYLVRHAEKACEDCATCGLKIPEGEDRANTLADSLLREGIDYIYASQCNRTQKTAEPLANLLEKTITIYQTDQLNSFITTLRNIKRNRDILVVGHSNQIPVMIDSLVHQQVTIGPDDYDNLFIITKRRFIFKHTTLEQRTYGVETP